MRAAWFITSVERFGRVGAVQSANRGSRGSRGPAESCSLVVFQTQGMKHPRLRSECATKWPQPLGTAHATRTLSFALPQLKVIDVPRFVQHASLGLVLAHLLIACGSPSSNDTAKGGALPEAECEGRSQDFAPGTSTSSRDGSLSVELVSATPEVPSNTDNFWTVALADADMNPVDAATIVAVPYMVDHGHGTAPQLATAMGEGRYELGPITLTMPGFWEVTLEVTLADGAKTSAIYAICVQAK